MANLLNYQESSGGMLMLETQQRGIGTKTTTVTVSDTSAGEPPSPLINIGGARFHHQPSPHSSVHHPGLQPKDQHHHRQPHHLTEDNFQEDDVRKRSSSSTNQSHEDAAAAAAGHSLSSTADSAFAAAVCTDGVEADIWKCGYLRKQKHGHKRFFVLRGQSHAGPSRLEYYDSEKKFRNSLRSAAGVPSAALSPKRVIYLYQCFTVNKRADAKHKYLIALYTKDEYFAMVAENEQEQTDWYLALSDLMNEGKKRPVDPGELDDGYGALPPSAGFKEVWQVNVKPKGLGQTKNLTGVYRLCLSAKSMHLVKLNSDMPCVNLQLMNIRRCGHSESFFFIEVGRSSSTGPGEIWMQVEDSVVAQNMHETILETMKALKAFAEFRPRSKSQSSGSNPMAFVTSRRHLGNLPPSQTGLQRRSRTDAAAPTGTPPAGKSGAAGGAYRFRTSSEGEGTMNRPFRSIAGGHPHAGPARSGGPGRQEGGAGGRYHRAQPGPSCHVRSASLPVSHFPSASSPVSVSSSSGRGSASDTFTRPSSSSVCGSPSDGGFNSSDEYGSSPCDFRYFRVRSNTPESLGNTPPIQEEHCLSDYMAMDRYGHPQAEVAGEDRPSCCQTFSSRPAGGGSGGGLTAGQPKTTQTASLDEARSALSSSPGPVSSRSCSDAYCQAELPVLSRSRRDPARDDGYMPMLPGAAPSREADYMPMLPSASPAQPSGGQPVQADPQGYMMMLPPGRASSPAWGGAREGRAGPKSDEYMDMSLSGPAERCPAQCPAQRPAPDSPGSPGAYFSLPRSYKAPVLRPGARPLPGSCSPNSPPDPLPQDAMAPAQQRPTRLSLGGEAAPEPPPEPPSSPGEYIDIEFRARPPNPPAEAPRSPRCSPRREDYLSLDTHAPRLSLVAPWNPPSYSHPVECSPAHISEEEGAFGAPARSQRSDPRAEPKLIRATPQGRRRHSSETFSSSSSSSPGGAAAAAAAPPARDSAPCAASFDGVWLRMEGAADPADDPSPSASVGAPCPNGLNYIALDLRDAAAAAPDLPPSPSAPVPVPADNGLYASIDFSRSDRLAAATSKAD